MKHKIKWLTTIQNEHHYITTNMTNKKNETVYLVEQGLTQEWIQEWSRDRMSDCSLYWLGGNKEGIDQNSAQHDFLAASDPSVSDAPFCPQDVDFFLWDFWAFSHLSHSACSLWCVFLHPEQWSRMFCAVMPANAWQTLYMITIP